MALKEQISDDIKTAMKARDKERTSVLRMLLSEIKYAEVAEGAAETLSDSDVLSVISTYAKRLRKSIVDFEGTDKLPELHRELVIIEEYLPKKASKEELSHFISDLIAKSDEKNFGVLMKQVLGHFGAAADGKEVSTLLKEKLS